MMLLSELKVKGFRSLEDVDVPLNDLTVLVGRNNAGKSNILAAVKLLLDGSPKDVSLEDFYCHENDPCETVTIEGWLEGVEPYLVLCDEKRHRPKIERCVENGRLQLRRQIRRDPLELGKLEIWDPEKRSYSVPTGIDAALKQIVPEVVFIEAFTDPVAEATGRSTATLGKILKQIVGPLEETLGSEITSALKSALRRLEVVDAEDPFVDERAEELKRVEERLRKRVRDVFSESDVRLTFTLPQLADVLSTARLELRDHGPWTSPALKGQGFQRALYVALLQVLAAELRESQTEGPRRPFILLFEEAEAFLHPSLQAVMGEALDSISSSNQAMCTSHSPTFVTLDRLSKVLLVSTPMGNGLSQGTRCVACNASALPEPDDKQLVNLMSVENSSEFLFSDLVLVTEGLSDRTLMRSAWSVRSTYGVTSTARLLAIVESGNTTSVPVWLQYLSAIGIPARGLVDLDFLWSSACEKLVAQNLYSDFSEPFWRRAEELGLTGENGRSIKKGSAVLELVCGELWAEAKAVLDSLREECSIWTLESGTIEDAFGFQREGVAKGYYTEVASKVRSGEWPLSSEVQQVLSWLAS